MIRQELPRPRRPRAARSHVVTLLAAAPCVQEKYQNAANASRPVKQGLLRYRGLLYTRSTDVYHAQGSKDEGQLQPAPCPRRADHHAAGS